MPGNAPLPLVMLQGTTATGSNRCQREIDRMAGQTEHNSYAFRLKALLHALIFGVTLAQAAIAQVTFSETTDSAGVSRTGESYGVSWGDFNGDGYPDIWLNNHADAPSLFINDTLGGFTDEAGTVWDGTGGDTHGAIWGDFDNDGDQDLFETTGSQQANNLFVNDNGQLTNQAVAQGLALAGSRSRSATWLDWNRDGRLDVLLAHALGPSYIPVLLLGSPTGFTDATASAGLMDMTSVAAYLGDLTNDMHADVIFSTGNPNGGPIYSASLPSWNELTAPASGISFPAVTGCADTTVADFNGDGETDFVAVCASGNREVVLSADGKVRAYLPVGASELAFGFDSTAIMDIDVFSTFGFVANSAFVVGEGNEDMIEAGTFGQPLDPSDEFTHGIPDYDPGVDEGVFVGYDVAEERWRIAYSTPESRSVSLVITSNPDNSFANIEGEGFSIDPAEILPYYIERDGDQFVNRTVAAGLDVGVRCSSIVSGDFDNDADQDLFLACSTRITNQPNLLFLNDGSGNFTQAGTTGAEGTTLGSGDSVAVADYDLDGFLDLFVTNGFGSLPFNGGPNQLFLNDGNSNNWIQIDLVGGASNRDAIGATVKLTAGGKTQARFVDGGAHRRAQDFKRVHFGLGTSDIVDELEITWPSGSVSYLRGVAVNQILTVREGPSPTAITAAADATADGVSESALLRTGSVRVSVRDGASGAALSDREFFGDGFRPAGLISLPDINNNSIPELAALGDADSGEIRLRVADSSTGNGIRNFAFFTAGHSPVDLAPLVDISGNGAADVALLVRRQSDGVNLVAVRDALTGISATGTNQRFLGPEFNPIDLTVIPDQDSDSIEELAVVATRSADGRIVAEIRSADAKPGFSRIWYLSPGGFTLVDAALGEDADGNGTPELAVLAIRDSDGRAVVERRNVTGPPATSRHWFFDANWRPMGLLGIGDTTDAGNLPEYAVLGIRSDGRAAVEIRNAGSPADTVRRFTLAEGFDPLGLADFGDTNSNGEVNLGVAGTRRSDGRIRLDIRDARGNPNTAIRWFAP